VTNVADIRESSWKRLLLHTQEGKLTKDLGNAILYLLNHPAWKGSIAYDEFGDRTYWAKQAPKLDDAALPAPRKGDEISDRDAMYLHHWFATEICVKFPLEGLLKAVEYVAHQNKTCPPREYLRGLKWDGVPRLASMFERYFGTKPTEYAANVGRWWMISAVARMLEPGCKADCILILQGPQGAKKSTALHVLGGDWYSNSLPDVTSKDAAIALGGSWILEIPELEAMNRSATTAFKDFSARTFDKDRPPYGRFQITRERMCVFAGTTNEDKILNDPTGARRFWPVNVAETGPISIERLRADREQLWAEAVHEYERGELWHPTGDIVKQVVAEQDERFADDAWSITIAKWCDHWERTGGADFTLQDVMVSALGIEPAKIDAHATTRVGKILRRMNYRATGRRLIGERRFSVYVAQRPELRLTNREPGEDDD
jgi:putative DNA primase/helicase